MARGRRIVRLVAIPACLALAGCGLNLRLPTHTTAPVASSAAAEPAGASPARGVPAITHDEVATPPGPDESAPASADPAAALRRFATRYINWTATDVAAQLRSLAHDSVGQARSALVLEARETAADDELRRGGIANHGTVEAVSALASGAPCANPGGLGCAASGSPARYVIVTRESTTASDSDAYQGLAPAWHLTVATVTRRAGGWVISGWQPES